MEDQTQGKQANDSETSQVVQPSAALADKHAGVFDALRAGLPKSEIKQKNGFDYVSAVYVIHAANEIFGFGGWRSEVTVAPHVIDRFTRAKNGGENIIAVVSCTVRVHAVGTAHDGVGMGTAEAVIDTFSGNLDKAFKEAETDALKRALIKFGDPFGLTLYEKDAADRNIVDDTGAAKTAAPTGPTLDADPRGHYIALLKSTRTQVAFEKILSGGLRKTHPDLEKGVWAETQAHYKAIPKDAPARPETSTKFVAPFGKNKGTPLADLDDKDLAYFAKKAAETLADESKANFHNKTRSELAAIEAEQAYRASAKAAA